MQFCEGERKKESKRETYKQVAVKRNEKKRKMVPVLKWLTGHNVNFHLGFEF